MKKKEKSHELTPKCALCGDELPVRSTLPPRLTDPIMLTRSGRTICAECALGAWKDSILRIYGIHV